MLKRIFFKRLQWDWRMKILLTLYCVLTYSSASFSQDRSSSDIGTAKGLVRDSVHNYVLQSATVSIYKAGTDELVSYQLTNNFGRFNFKQLPVDVPLRIVATNVGYVSAKRDFTISSATKDIELQTLNMERSPISLKEVTISGVPPPVQMRGDTLEFNADAFKLDSNAVVEDMLRKIPGVTVWNDGLITVNGKKINRLLVEGKEFFGKDGKIALQNLQKGAVKKIQVYEDQKESDPIEPLTNMNIVLKKDKKEGYFGKVAIGLGTAKRYDGNGTINYYSPRNQISIGGSINDVNRTANNITTLNGINSFKGEGIGNDYHIDFSKPGATVFKAVGISASHDFGRITDDKIDTNLFKIDYFMTANNTLIRENLNTEVSLGSQEFLSQTAANTSDSKSNMKVLNAKYEKKYDHSRLLATYDLQHNSLDVYNTRRSAFINNSTNEQSESNDVQGINSASWSQIGNIKYLTQRYRDYGRSKNKSVTMDLSYGFGLNQVDRESRRITDLRTTDVAQNQHFNRRYITKSNLAFHSLDNSFNDILKLFNLANSVFRVDVRNSFLYRENKQTDNVGDFSGFEDQYIPNSRLSTYNHTREFSYKPGLNFSKNLISNLSGRYRKAWSFNILGESEIYTFKNKSTHNFQNLVRPYFYFTPSSSIGYKNYQLGNFRETYMLKYFTRVQYPTLQQLAPIVDDANVFSFEYGNVNLKASYVHDVSFSYGYNNADAKNPFHGDLNVVVGLTNDFISDSSYYDELGRRVFYPVNVKGERHASGTSSVQKAFKYDSHQFQLSGKSGISYSKFPSSIDGKSYETIRQTWSAEADMTYTYRELLITRIGGVFQKGSTSRIGSDLYKYANLKTFANMSLSIPNGLFVNTTFEVTRNTSTNNDKMYFSIWNLDVGYRFLKGANGEIKISGLDLLRQNKNIINYVNNNSITSGTVNVLRQYFMITIAYYPRKFGLNKKLN